MKHLHFLIYMQQFFPHDKIIAGHMSWVSKPLTPQRHRSIHHCEKTVKRRAFGINAELSAFNKEKHKFILFYFIKNERAGEEA